METTNQLERKPRGRPKFAPGVAKNTISLALSPRVLNWLTERSNASGLSKSAVVERTIMEKLGH